MLDNEKISLVIPAYNEERQIGNVLKVASPLKWIDEIITIDDGSSDGTRDAIGSFPIQLIQLAGNCGKGAALQRGLESVKAADIILFLDADLIGLSEDHLKLLVEPLLNDKDLAMTVGRFAGGRWSTDLSQRIAPILNGQRALRAWFAKELPDLSGHRYGVEIFISTFAKKNNYKSKEIVLRGLSQVLKEEKEGVIKGTVYRYKMYGDLWKTWRKKS